MELRKVEVWVCEDCLNGFDDDRECASPECIFFGHSSPDHAAFCSNKAKVIETKKSVANVGKNLTISPSNQVALKAYMVHPGEFPCDVGCLLIFAKSRNNAKMYALECGPWDCGTYGDYTYIEFRAIRKPVYDKYSDQCGMSVETNAGLPEGAPPFYDDEKDYYQDNEEI